MEHGAPLDRIAMRMVIKTIDVLVREAGESLSLDDRRVAYELRRRLLDNLDADRLDKSS